MQQRLCLQDATDNCARLLLQIYKQISHASLQQLLTYLSKTREIAVHGTRPMQQL